MGACCVSPLVEFETRVCRMPPGTASSMLAGPRLAVGSRGQILCTFVAQTASGTNDFKPMLASSADGGRTWSESRPIWPELFERYSIFGSVSRGHDGRLLFFGSRTVIDVPGEPFWSDATQGLKPNELVWSSSPDDGQTWAPFQVIPQPIPGSAEAWVVELSDGPAAGGGSRQDIGRELDEFLVRRARRPAAAGRIGAGRPLDGPGERRRRNRRGQGGGPRVGRARLSITPRNVLTPRNIA